MKKLLLVFTVIGLLASPVSILAQGKQPDGGAVTVADQYIQDLIKQLGDTDFNKRTKATEELKKIGKPALPLLEKAATDSDAEIRVRAKSIIKAINDPPKAQKPAGGMEPKDLLGGLGGGDGGIGDMLGGLLGGAGGGAGGGNDMSGLLGGLLGGAGGGGGDMSGLLGSLLGGGGMAAPQGPQFMLMPPTVIKESTKQFKFSHKVVIVVEVTETKDGKEVKRIVYADDEEELKEKDPEAYKVYSKLIRAQMGQ